MKTMKKALTLILAIVMALGCMSITAFAEETDNTTDITLTVTKSLTYEMVIPEDVKNLDNFGVFEVGQAKVKDVKNATEKTVISYTAETTAFKCDGKSDIPATYYTDAEGATAFPTEAVEVYKNKADAASIPTMYVGISENDWNAAENGTYTATVTFNFEAEEAEAPAAVTAADALVTGAQFRLTGNMSGGAPVVATYQKTDSGFTCVSLTVNTYDASGNHLDTCQLNDDSVIYFKYGMDNFLEISIDTATGIYRDSEGGFTKFEVKPAGAAEFTEVILAQAQPE